MPEEDNIGSAADLRRLNSWLEAFDLTDSEVLALINIIGEVIWGDIDLDEFWQKIQTAVLKNNEVKKQIAIAAANNRLMDFKDEIGDVDGFIKSLGGEVTVEPLKAKSSLSQEEINNKLSQYDWSKIVGIERRALLEELGVSLKDFVKWLGEQK